MQISGLKDKELKIRYYHRSDGSPMNFKAKGDGIHIYSESGITFLEDSCIFLKEGVTIDNNVQFTGDISKKESEPACLVIIFPLLTQVKSMWRTL